MLEILNLMVDQGLGNLREKTLSSSFWCDHIISFMIINHALKTFMSFIILNLPK